MGNIISGKKVMIFVKEGETYRSVGFATNHTFSTSASTIDIAHKDLADTASGAGKWVDEDVDTFSWTISTENFYATEADGLTFADLFNLYSSGTELEVKFGLAPTSTTGVPTDGWTPQTGGQMLAGKCIITSLDMNASVSERASFSATFTGKGPVALAV